MTERIDPIVVDQNDPAGHRLDVPASFCVEAHALESVCRVEHSSRTSEDFGFSKLHKHEIGDNTKCEGSQYMSSPIIKHFFVSLFAVLRSLHSQESHSRVMHHGVVPFGQVVVSRVVVQEDQRKEQRPKPDRRKRLLRTLGRRLL